MAVMDILIRATDRASEVMDKVSSSGASAAQSLEQNWLKVTAAGVAVGGAMMKVTGRSHELNEGIRRVAHITGESEDSLRDMTLALTDATFSNDDAVRAMERLVKAGVTSKDQFEKMLPVFDTYSDAIGTDITQSIDLFDRVLSALDIPMEEANEHLDTMAFLATQTTVNMDNLGMLMRREAPAMKDMGLSVDDVAVAMAALEAEGRRGPRAVMGFQDAIKDAEGDVDEFWKALGVTNETLEEQQQKLAGSAGLTEELAEINNASLGIWDNLKKKVDDAMWSMGTFMEPVKDLGPLLMGLGPMIKAISTIKASSFIPAVKGAAVATMGFTKALLANPMTWVVAGIMLLIGAIYLLWKNWDTVSEWLSESWEWLKEKVGDLVNSIVDWFRELPGRLWEFLMDVMDRFRMWREDITQQAYEAISTVVETILTFLAALPGQIWDFLVDIITRFWEWRNNLIDAAREAAIGVLTSVIDRISRIPGQVWSWLVETVKKVVQWRRDMIQRAREAARGAWDSIVNVLKRLPGRMLQLGRDAITNLARGIRNAVSGALGSAVNSAKNLLNRLNPFSRSSPSLVEYFQMGMKEIEKSARGLDLPDFSLERDEVDVDPSGHTVRTRAIERASGTEERTMRLVHIFQFDGLPEWFDEKNVARMIADALAERPELRAIFDEILYDRFSGGARATGGEPAW